MTDSTIQRRCAARDIKDYAYWDDTPIYVCENCSMSSHNKEELLKHLVEESQ